MRDEHAFPRYLVREFMLARPDILADELASVWRHGCDHVLTACAVYAAERRLRGYEWHPTRRAASMRARKVDA